MHTFQSFSGGYAGPVHATRYNTIVIGMGGMGSAAAYHLARRGQRVLGLEQFDVPHDQGSSHGYTRIIRMAYYEHPSYVMLLRRAYELWREIEERSGEQLLHITGSIDAGAADSWVFKGALQAAMEHELPHEVLTGVRDGRAVPRLSPAAARCSACGSPTAASSRPSAASSPTSSRRCGSAPRSTAASACCAGSRSATRACACTPIATCTRPTAS